MVATKDGPLLATYRKREITSKIDVYTAFQLRLYFLQQKEIRAGFYFLIYKCKRGVGRNTVMGMKKNYTSFISKGVHKTDVDYCTPNMTQIQGIKTFVRWMSKDLAILDYFAGDVDRIPRDLWGTIERLRKNKGDELYIDLLQALTHKRFSLEEAKQLWEEIIVHKYYMSEKLGRNVGVKVAVLDYLDNHSGKVKDFHLLPEKDLDCLLFFVNEDGLTGLFNHRYFQEHLRDELARCHRYNRTFSLLFIDLDHFKAYNDNLGHMKGDILLREIATFFKNFCREADAVARYGGDEFAFILPETNNKEAVSFAKRLLHSFQKQAFGVREPGYNFIITISAGVATYPTDGTYSEQLIEAADQALYQAKRAGRNCVRRVRQPRSLADREPEIKVSH